MASRSAGRYAHHTDFAVVADCFTCTYAARIVGVTARTMQRWLAGKARIPWAAYQLLYEYSRYGLAERDSAEHFERTMICGELTALRSRVSELEAELLKQARLVDWGCANDPFILPGDVRSVLNLSP